MRPRGAAGPAREWHIGWDEAGTPSPCGSASSAGTDPGVPAVLASADLDPRCGGLPRLSFSSFSASKTPASPRSTQMGRICQLRPESWSAIRVLDCGEEPPLCGPRELRCANGRWPADRSSAEPTLPRRRVSANLDRVPWVIPTVAHGHHVVWMLQRPVGVINHLLLVLA